MQTKVMVQTDILSSYSKPFESIILELIEAEMTVSTLIRRTVEKQVEQSTDWRRLEWEKVRKILEKRCTPQENLEMQQQQGVIQVTEIPSSKREEEISRAMHRFKKGEYIIFLDGKQLQSLEETITLTSTSKIIFLKLFPLMGG